LTDIVNLDFCLLAARAGDQDVAAKVDAAERGTHFEGAVASYEQDTAEPVAAAAVFNPTVPPLLFYAHSVTSILICGCNLAAAGLSQMLSVR